MRLRLSEGTSIVFIDGQPLIFSVASQQLMGVNQVAGYVACRLEDGVPFAQLAQEVLDRGITEPLAMLRKVLTSWSLRGLVSACDPPPASHSLTVQQVSIGGRKFLLRYHDRGLAARVSPLFAHLQADCGLFDVVYDLWHDDGMACLSRDGAPATIMEAAQTGPVIKARMAEDILGSPGWLLGVHGGCLHRNGKAMLILGEPGAGKTTLTSWLTGQGFAYGGDDIVVVSGDGRVQGLPFLPSVKAGGWKLLASVYGGLGALPMHVRADRRRVRFPAPRVIAGDGLAEIGWIVRLRRRAAGPAQLAPLQSSLALRHLLEEATSHGDGMSHRALDVMIRAVGGARCYELHYAGLDDAGALLRRMSDNEAA